MKARGSAIIRNVMVWDGEEECSLSYVAIHSTLPASQSYQFFTSDIYFILN